MARETILIEEYKELQYLRGLWSSGMGGWGNIFVPLAAAIFAFFVTQYLTTDCSGNNVIFLWVGWVLFLVVMLYWRLTVHHIDQQIVAMYPRMLELEGILGMEMQSSYYFNNLREKAKISLANKINISYDELKKWDYRIYKKHAALKNW